MGAIQGFGEYDIGYVTPWSFPNYGTALTQYSMYRVLKDFGLSVLMIERPLSAERRPEAYPIMYRVCPYMEDELEEPLPHLKAMGSLNEKCKIFVLGSDQLYNNYLYNLFGRFVTLDWVRDYKKKIGYAISFGFDYIFGSEFDRAEMHRCLQKFDALSVREKSGMYLLKNEFGVNSEHVLDPVFLCEKSYFYGVASNSSYKRPNVPYYFAYILDPNKSKQKMLKAIELETMKEILVVSDAERSYEESMESLSFPILKNSEIKVEDWLDLLIHSEGVITDSYHGTCFSLIFDKPFVALANKIRGITRFESILSLSNLRNRLLYEERYGEASSVLQTEINYIELNNSIEQLKKNSMDWLQENLFGLYSKKALSDYDKINIRIDSIEDSVIQKIEELGSTELRIREAIANIKKIRRP